MIIAIVRVLGSLPVLFFPFPGAIIAMLTDQSDLFLMNLLHLGGVQHYQRSTSGSTRSTCSRSSSSLCAGAGRPEYRGRSLRLPRHGDIAFEITGERAILFAFPNLFEFWFVFVAGIKHFHLENSPP